MGLKHLTPFQKHHNFSGKYLLLFSETQYHSTTIRRVTNSYPINLIFM